MSNELKVRYSDEELEEFKVLIEDKLAKAEEELNFTQSQIAELNENGFNQQGGDWYDDTSTHTDLEMLQRMMVRQQQHVTNLKNALIRVHNKTYGICAVTGQLIDKKRLYAVPHATKSVEGKVLDNANAPQSVDTSYPNDFPPPADEPAKSARPVGDKVRLGGSKKSAKSGEEWEAFDQESMEDAGYNTRKFEDDED